MCTYKIIPPLIPSLLPWITSKCKRDTKEILKRIEPVAITKLFTRKENLNWLYKREYDIFSVEEVPDKPIELQNRFLKKEYFGKISDSIYIHLNAKL